MRRRGEAAHVGADLGQDYLRAAIDPIPGMASSRATAGANPPSWI